MSTGKHLAWAMDYQGELPSGEWAVLKAMAKAADHSRGVGVIFARMAYLAAEASKSVRQVRTLVRRLEKRGLAFLVRGDTSRRTNHWVLACSPEVLAAQEPRNLAEDRRFNRKSPPVSNRKSPPVKPEATSAIVLVRDKESSFLDELPTTSDARNEVHPSEAGQHAARKEDGSGTDVPASPVADRADRGTGDDPAPLSWDGLTEAVAGLCDEWDKLPARVVGPRQKGHHPLVVAAAAWNRVARRHNLAPVKPWNMSHESFRLIRDMWGADYRLFFVALGVLDDSPSARRLCPTLDAVAAKLVAPEDWKRWIGSDMWAHHDQHGRFVA